MTRKAIWLLTPLFALLLCNGLPAQQRPGAALESAAVATDSQSTLLGGRPTMSALALATAGARNPAALSTSKSPQAASPSGSMRLGSITITGGWRFRTEAWDWFQPSSGQNAYAFEHSLLRVAIGQKRESSEWLLEGAQDAIVDLPQHAVVSGAQGQLGLGATYFAANGDRQNNVNGFLKQAYVAFNLPGNAKMKLGRFTFLDGAEVAPKDKTIAALVNTRIAQRLIGDFGFSAVQRSFDGLQLSFNDLGGNLTFFGARPTRGVFQSDGLGEVSVDLFYGAYTVPFSFGRTAAELRVFSAGYIDERGSVLKTDNRPLALRSADHNRIQIGTYGADYVHVLHTPSHGQFDLVAWGALQDGSWGAQAQRAGAFVAEAGWQPSVSIAHPWFNAGYSFGSGDSNQNDDEHHTFFQLLPTPRVYARFPFYNMMNNEDFYGSVAFRLPKSLAVRSEVHALRLASAQDLWYAGGGPFQPKTFGYTGRTSGGDRSLANILDASLDVPLPYRFSVTVYYAHAWGKSVVANAFPRTQAQFGYAELNYHF